MVNRDTKLLLSINFYSLVFMLTTVWCDLICSLFCALLSSTLLLPSLTCTHSPRLSRQQKMRIRSREMSPDIRQIDLDVNRTFRNHIMFRDRYGIIAARCVVENKTEACYEFLNPYDKPYKLYKGALIGSAHECRVDEADAIGIDVAGDEPPDEHPLDKFSFPHVEGDEKKLAEAEISNRD